MAQCAVTHFIAAVMNIERIVIPGNCAVFARRLRKHIACAFIRPHSSRCCVVAGNGCVTLNPDKEWPARSCHGCQLQCCWLNRSGCSIRRDIRPALGLVLARVFLPIEKRMKAACPAQSGAPKGRAAVCPHAALRRPNAATRTHGLAAQRNARSFTNCGVAWVSRSHAWRLHVHWSRGLRRQ